MATYLLAWNPKRWIWEDLAEMALDVKEGQFVTTRWSCGNSKRMKQGDRVFLIRLGEEPKGIIASGEVLTDAYEDIHWAEEKAAAGETGVYVQVHLDTLLDPETNVILPRDSLNDARFSQMHWDTQMSGVRIPDEIALELEKTWAIFSTNHDDIIPEEVSDTKAIFEGALRRISVNSYERNPEARRKCLEHYGAICVICGFDFAKTYGSVGKGFIHVHHLKELCEVKEEYKVDPINDLRPICPNCHAIVHRRKPVYSISEVQAFLQKKS